MFSSVLSLILAASFSTALAATIACDLSAPPQLFSQPSWQFQNLSSCHGPAGVYTVKPSPNKGLGVFATRDLPPGTPIIHEAPLVTIIPPDVVQGVGYPLDKIALSLRQAFSLLSKEDQATYLSLHAHIFPDEEFDDEDHLMPIFRSNAFNTGDSFGLFPKVARINHSCRPNASYMWNPRLRKRVVYAVGTIREGEEITISYIPLLRTKEERTLRLDQYGFKCACEACSAAADEILTSNWRRASIRQGMESLEKDLSAEQGSGVVAKRKAERLVKESMEIVDLVTAEGLVDYYASAYRLAALAHGGVENWDVAADWAMKSLEYWAMADEEMREAREMRVLASQYTQMSKGSLKSG